jgi:hypothetical protein
MESKIFQSIYDNPDLITDLKENKFQGFVTVAKLRDAGCDCVPKERGVYMVLDFCSMPEFLEEGVGGWFKGKDPNVSLDKLRSNWVDNASILYIGETGSNNSIETLRTRIELFMKFGREEPVGHWGGRYVWQQKNHADLMIYWLATDCNPRQKKKALLAGFVTIHGKLPFANLKR